MFVLAERQREFNPTRSVQSVMESSSSSSSVIQEPTVCVQLLSPHHYQHLTKASDVDPFSCQVTTVSVLLTCCLFNKMKVLRCTHIMMEKQRLILNLLFSITTPIFCCVNYNTHQYKNLQNKFVAMQWSNTFLRYSFNLGLVQ